jgi:hypothetical protein
MTNTIRSVLRGVGVHRGFWPRHEVYLYPIMSVPMIGLGMGLSAISLRLLADPDVEINKQQLKPNTYFSDWQFTRALRNAKWKKAAISMLSFANDQIYNTHTSEPIFSFLAPFAMDRFETYSETRPISDYDVLYSDLLEQKIQQQKEIKMNANMLINTQVHAPKPKPLPVPAVSRARKPEPEISYEEAEAELFSEEGGVMLLQTADEKEKEKEKKRPTETRDLDADLQELQTAGILLSTLVEVREQISLAAKEAAMDSEQQTTKKKKHEKKKEEREEPLLDFDGLPSELPFQNNPSFLFLDSLSGETDFDYFCSIFSSPFE